jgi:general secretion pathway protein A
LTHPLSFRERGHDTDRIATAALRAAARKKKKLVERDVLTRILQAESEDRS